MIRSFVLAAALVTATVTSPVAQQAATYSAVITDNRTGEHWAYNRLRWPDQMRCDQAILGIQDQLSSIAVKGPIPPADEADQDVLRAAQNLVMGLYSRDHKLPSLGISCEALGDPT